MKQHHGVDVCGEKQEGGEGIPSSVLTVGLHVKKIWAGGC